MPTYNASFKGGSIDASTGAIYTTDTVNNKALTITFTSNCPGSGLDGGSTTVRLSGVCSSSLQGAVTNKRKVNLMGTRSVAPPTAASLSDVTHTIV